MGDTGGVPQNLLEGLGLVCGQQELGLQTDRLRAMFAAVLGATEQEFGRPRGFVARRGQGRSERGFEGTSRVAIGLVEMLEALGP